MPEAELQRIADRAGLDGAPVRLHRLGYIDRQGWANLPLEAGVALAEPETVLMYIEAQEQQLKADSPQLSGISTTTSVSGSRPSRSHARGPGLLAKPRCFRRRSAGFAVW